MNKFFDFLTRVNLDYVLFIIFVIGTIILREKINYLEWIATFLGFILVRLNKINNTMK